MFTMDCELPDHPSKILIVDDEPSSLLELSTILGSLGEVHTASTGENALELTYELMPDVIMLDIEMPGIDGFEVCKQLRSNPLTRHIGIIFVTVHTDHHNEIASLSLGAVDFIHKPIDHKICHLRVRNLLLIREQAKKLAEAKDEVIQLVGQVPNFISYWDKDWHNLFSNDDRGTWFGLGKQELLKQHLSLIFPKTVIEAMQQCSPSSDGRHQLTTGFEVGMNNPRHFVITWSETSYQGHQSGYLMTISDITHQKQVESHLEQQKQHLNVILSSVAEGVIATDERGLITFINPKAELITGWRQSEAFQKPIEVVMQLRDPDTKINTENPIRISLRQQRVTSMPLNTQLVARDGRLSQIEQTAAPLRDPEGYIVGAVAVIHDISQSVSLTLLRHQASSYDQLTNVPNRLFIREKLQLATDAVKVSDICMALAVLDVDHFKFFNDAHGNSTGDAVLKALARRMFENYEPEHSVGRLGADEFMLILRGDLNGNNLDSALHSLLDLVRAPLTVEEKQYSLSVSIGVSLISKKGSCDPDTIMQQADAALYRAKFEGGDRYKVFTADLERSLLQRRSTEELLRESLHNKEKLHVYYQPKVDLNSNRVTGCEALARIQDQQDRLIPPNEFIPIAEETGLIIQLGRLVLEKACKDCRDWLKKGLDIPVSVNISAVQCLNEDLVQMIGDVLYVTGLPAEYLELEVTETAFIRDFDKTLDKFRLLKEIGVKLAIDDFGKGYSNLTYLRRMDVDMLKIDMSYVKGMLNNQRDYEIVKTIVNLGQSMQLDLVAEGVESTEHVDALLKLGCHLGQGYLYARPLPIKQFSEFLQDNLVTGH